VRERVVLDRHARRAGESHSDHHRADGVGELARAAPRDEAAVSPKEARDCPHAEDSQQQETAHRVHASKALRDYIVALLRRTRDDDRTELGASPRAGLMLLRAARRGRS
jgi:MoxR-like ATPase